MASLQMVEASSQIVESEPQNKRFETVKLLPPSPESQNLSTEKTMEMTDSASSSASPITTLSCNLENQLPADGSMTISVALFHQFMTKVDTQFNYVKQELRCLKTMQSEILDVNNIAVEALETAQEHANDIEKLNQKVQTLEEKLQQAETEASETKFELNKINLELKSVKDSNSSIDNYLKRDNLLFLNVPFAVNENCEKTIRGIMASMGIEDSSEIKFVRCHRVKMGKAPFPIICRFHYFGDRQRVFDKRKELKGTNVFVEEHFSEETYKQRKALLPIQLAARKQGLKSFLKLDKVMIDGKLYGVNDLENLPVSLKYVATCSKQNDEVVAFFGERSPLSNFYKTSFTDGSTTYHSTEMYLQHHKALLFQDEVTAYKIANSKSPAHSKALSYQIKGVDQAVWENKAPGIMKKGLELKFNADFHCKMTLIETGNRLLGEATSSDKFWGTGMALFDSLALNHGGWSGQNVMGKLLNEVRDQLTF